MWEWKQKRAGSVEGVCWLWDGKKRSAYKKKNLTEKNAASRRRTRCPLCEIAATFERSRNVSADVAQLAEHLICNQGVGGSTPSISNRVLERYLSGQQGRTVNPLAQPSLVRIQPSPWSEISRAAGDDMERYLSGQQGRTVNPLAQPSLVRIQPSPFKRV